MTQDQNSAKQLMNDFLNSQQVNGQIINNPGTVSNHKGGSGNMNKNRLLSANKNQSQLGMPMSDQKTNIQRNAALSEFQT